MKASRVALSLLVVGGVVGCFPDGQQAAFPQSDAVRHLRVSRTQSRAHGWMLPGATSMNLLYVSDQGKGVLFAFSYPKGDLVGEVTVPSKYPSGLCSDGAGNVFVTTAGTFLRATSTNIRTAERSRLQRSQIRDGQTDVVWIPRPETLQSQTT